MFRARNPEKEAWQLQPELAYSSVPLVLLLFVFTFIASSLALDCFFALGKPQPLRFYVGRHAHIRVGVGACVCVCQEYTCRPKMVSCMTLKRFFASLPVRLMTTISPNGVEMAAMVAD